MIHGAQPDRGRWARSNCVLDVGGELRREHSERTQPPQDGFAGNEAPSDAKLEFNPNFAGQNRNSAGPPAGSRQNLPTDPLQLTLFDSTSPVTLAAEAHATRRTTEVTRRVSEDVFQNCFGTQEEGRAPYPGISIDMKIMTDTCSRQNLHGKAGLH